MNSSQIVGALFDRELGASRVRARLHPSYFSSGGPERGNGVIANERDGSRSPPFALAFAERRDSGQLLAFGDEAGFLTLTNTGMWDPDCYNEPALVADGWPAHFNAIFDIAWIRDDRQVLTASGDQTIRAWDVERRFSMISMVGHKGSVKSICRHPSSSDCFASGARDGRVMLWDLRTTNGGSHNCIKPCTVIPDAHRPSQRRPRRPKGTVHGDLNQSVTAVLFLTDDRFLATGGAAQKMVKFWDVRNLKKPLTATPELAASDSSSASRGRRQGIVSLSQDAMGTGLIASCTDRNIYLLDPQWPARGPLQHFSGHQPASFFTKAKMSPDGASILSGSSDNGAYIWQVARPHEPPTVRWAHDGEVTAVDWCTFDPTRIATASDDCTVRVWTQQRAEETTEPPSPCACCGGNDWLDVPFFLLGKISRTLRNKTAPISETSQGVATKGMVSAIASGDAQDLSDRFHIAGKGIGQPLDGCPVADKADQPKRAVELRWSSESAQRASDLPGRPTGCSAEQIREPRGEISMTADGESGPGRSKVSDSGLSSTSRPSGNASIPALDSKTVPAPSPDPASGGQHEQSNQGQACTSGPMAESDSGTAGRGDPEGQEALAEGGSKRKVKRGLLLEGEEDNGEGITKGREIKQKAGVRAKLEGAAVCSGGSDVMESNLVETESSSRDTLSCQTGGNSTKNNTVLFPRGKKLRADSRAPPETGKDLSEGCRITLRFMQTAQPEIGGSGCDSWQSVEGTSVLEQVPRPKQTNKHRRTIKDYFSQSALV